MDSSPADNRLLTTTPDNHQAWLWFTHVFLLLCVIVTGGMRIWRKKGNATNSDTVLLVAHVRFALSDFPFQSVQFAASHTLTLALATVCSVLDDHRFRRCQLIGKV